MTDPEFKSYWETFGPVQVGPSSELTRSCSGLGQAACVSPARELCTPRRLPSLLELHSSGQSGLPASPSRQTTSCSPGSLASSPVHSEGEQTAAAEPRLLQDAYMPKDASKAGHRGIGFVTFGSSEVLDKAVAASHQLHGQELAVDRAEPKLAVRPYHCDCCTYLSQRGPELTLHVLGPAGCLLSIRHFTAGGCHRPAGCILQVALAQQHVPDSTDQATKLSMASSAQPWLLHLLLASLGPRVDLVCPKNLGRSSSPLLPLQCKCTLKAGAHLRLQTS